eukprot:gb/GECG01011732.1/.p1 GENE.gb/GECG01011732.1/~~gb/GECG01011732.1/.p1  ORF type:complete len:304 (+),score=37.65 gb/GECG01011732.1/:1-912(+)
MKCSLAVLVLMPLCLFQVQASGDASECCDISSDGVLTSCASCDFSSTGIVDLSYMGITEADPDTFDDAGGKSSVTEMYLQGNALAAVPETLFQEVVNIVILDLSNNSISSLHEKMFTGTSGLAGLTGNGGHQDLEKLFLQNNRIGSLPPRIFEILESITSINLGHNFLEDLDSDLFAELGTLIKLDLSCNNFSRVESNYFTGLAALKQLDLANNELSIIESAGLDPLENLENLYGHPYLVCNSWKHCFIPLLVLKQESKSELLSVSTNEFFQPTGKLERTVSLGGLGEPHVVPHFDSCACTGI